MKHIKTRIIFALLVVITMLAIECPTLNINADEPLEKIEELDPVAMEMSRILNLNKEKEAELEEKTKESVLEFTEAELEVQERIQDINEELIEELEAALPKKTYLGSYELTAYIATGNPCASGVYPQVNHTVACNSLPMGTRIYIEGYGEYVVEDTGGMANNVIDVFVSDYSTAINFGRRVAEVYIIEE
ncbi:MAG: 3D domain-containing protein [Eubacterium sp.]|nr:3D domain-containing protein [Eubacterium sp.]